jgi:tetratricopeptide (TPR) repeat protein
LKILILVAALSLSTITVHAQIELIDRQQKADSIERLLVSDTVIAEKNSRRLNMLGIWYSKSDRQRAVSYAYRALDLSKSSEDKLEQGIALQTLEVILRASGLYEQSMEYGLQSKDIFEFLQDTFHLYKSYNALGVNHSKIGNKKKSLDYFQKALALANIKGDSQLLARAHLNFGASCQENGNYDQALDHYKETEKILTILKSNVGLAYLYNNIAVVYTSKGLYDTSFKMLLNSYKVLPPAGDTYFATMLSVNLAESAWNRSKTDSCIYWASAGRSLAKKHSFPDQQMIASEWLSRGWDKKKDYKKSLDFLNESLRIKDSLFNQEKILSIQALHESYILGQKEKAINLLQAENGQRKLQSRIFMLASASAVAIILLLCVALIQKFRYAKNLNIEYEKIRVLCEILEIKALRSRVDPHFIFNALDGVQHFILMGNCEMALEHLNKVSKLIRRVLQKSFQDVGKLEDEIALVGLYLEIEKFRFPDKLNYEIQIDPKVKKAVLPFMILHPFVENAVIHGIVPLYKRSGHISIRANEDGHNICIEIEDDGVGRKNPSTNFHPGFESLGTSLIGERLRKLAALSKGKIELSIHDKIDQSGNAAGTKVTIKVEKNRFQSLANNEHMSSPNQSNISRMGRMDSIIPELR